MITYVRGDLFESPARVLVNTVNTVGVMGKGIAKTFKQLFPEMFDQYQKYCEAKMFTIGNLWIYKTPNKWILNFPTKTTWKEPSEIAYIEAGLKTFVKSYAAKGIDSIAFPLLGCGNGELNWELDVKPLMVRYLADLPIDVFIYTYHKEDGASPEHKSIKQIADWLRSEPENLNFDEAWSDLNAVLKEHCSTPWLDKSTGERYEIDCEEFGWTVRCSTSVPAVIAKEDISDIWSVLRAGGLVTQESVPTSQNYFGLILSVFSELKYCKVVSASPRYSALSDKRASLGLQLSPKSAEKGILEPLPESVKSG